MSRNVSKSVCSLSNMFRASNICMEYLDASPKCCFLFSYLFLLVFQKPNLNNLVIGSVFNYYWLIWFNIGKAGYSVWPKFLYRYNFSRKFSIFIHHSIRYFDFFTIKMARTVDLLFIYKYLTTSLIYNFDKKGSLLIYNITTKLTFINYSFSRTAYILTHFD